MSVRTGLLVDWGGVLTTSVFDAFAGFARREGLAANAVASLFRSDPAARELLVALETGVLDEAGFGAGLAPLLGVQPDALVARMMADARPDHRMLAAVAAARRRGVATGLISNSWGQAMYPAGGLAALFDGVVISGEVGLRKPDPRMYLLGARGIGRDATVCVFVDDLAGNLTPARDLGMATVLHTGAATTIPALEELLGVDLCD